MDEGESEMGERRMRVKSEGQEEEDGWMDGWRDRCIVKMEKEGREDEKERRMPRIYRRRERREER